MESIFDIHKVRLSTADQDAQMLAFTTRSFSIVTNYAKQSSLASNVFYNFSNITSIDFSAITEIGSGACRHTGISALVVDLNNSISIGNSAFAECYKLGRVWLPNNATLGTGVFSGCIALSEVSWPDCSSVPSSTFLGCKLLSDISFLKNCTYIGSQAFENCQNLTDLTALSNVSYIGASAFAQCSGISEIFLPNLIGVITSSGQSIRAWVPRQVQRIMLPRFQSNLVADNCYSLTATYLPYAQDAAFAYCSKLFACWAPKIFGLSNNIFKYCPKITELYFDDITSIDAYGVFTECSNLQYLYLAGSAVPTVHFPSSTPDAFKGTQIASGNGFIYVRESLVSVFQAAEYWSKFADRFVGLTNGEFLSIRQSIESKVLSYYYNS